MSERHQPTPQPRDTNQDTGQSSSSLQVLAGLLLTLAVVATVIMLVTTSTGAMKVAVISALWSALIGFFLVGKYRHDADQARDALAHERELLALELEKEQVTHREQERLLEQTYMDSLKEHQDETLAAIRAQLDEVRAQLEALTGQDFSYEPTALKAHAQRIAEISAPTPANTTPAQEAESTPVPGEPTGEVKKQPRDTSDVVDVEATDVARPGGRFDTGAFARVNWSPEAAVRSGSHRDDDPEKVRATDVAKAEAEKKAQAKAAAEAEAKAKAEAEAEAAKKKAAEDEAKAKAEAEKKAKAETEAKAKAEAEKKAKAEAEAKAKEEAEKKAKAEAAAKKAAEEAAARKAEEEARQKAAAEKEAALRAEELRRKKAAEEAAVKREQEFEARRLEEARRREEEERAAREFRQAQEEAARAKSESGRGGRRRRDEHTEGVSVADLLKNLQGTSKPARSRHRSED